MAVERVYLSYVFQNQGCIEEISCQKCPLNWVGLVYYSRVLNRLRFISTELPGKRKRQNEKFVARRRQRMSSVVADLFNERESDYILLSSICLSLHTNI